MEILDFADPSLGLGDVFWCCLKKLVSEQIGK
jgi:hypothetical protein